MKILMLTGTISRCSGGLFFSVRRLSQTLRSYGVNLDVAAMRDEYTCEDISKWGPIQPIIIESVGPKSFGSIPKIKKVIHEVSPDIVHLNGLWLPMSVATAAYSKEGGNVVVSPRGMLDPWALNYNSLRKMLALKAYEQRNLERARTLHALNVAEKESIQKIFPWKKVEVVPNGIDITDVKEKNVCNKGELNRRKILLYMGRIHPKKGLIRLVRQWADLPENLRDKWAVEIVGPDEDGHAMEVKELIGELGLYREFEFLGPAYGLDKQRIYEKADAFVLPSYSEGLPMAVLEAWSYGLPVLMTRECNLPEGFEEGAALEIGDDPNALAHALNRQCLWTLGERGKRLVSERFSWNNVAEQMLSLYRGVCN